MNWLVRLLTFVLFLVVAGTVGFVIVLERASRYPVEANFLTPWLERNASEHIQGGVVSIQETRIALEPGEGGARLLLTGVSASGGSVSAPLDVGAMTVAVSLPDLLLGNLRLTRLTIRDLSFGARRKSDGQFEFSIAPGSNQTDVSGLNPVPGLGSIAEASSSPETDATSLSSNPKPSPLDQLRTMLLDRNGLLSRFEELKLTGGLLVFDDVPADERVVVHDATLTFASDHSDARLSVNGLFEIGQSFADGQVTLTTPLAARGLELTTSMTDVALSDLTAYLPPELYLEERTDPVDLRFSASLSDAAAIQRFSVQQYDVGALREGNPTFAPQQPILTATGEKRDGGAGGWSLALQTAATTFAAEPALREALRDFISFDGDISGDVRLDIADDGRLLNVGFNTVIGAGQATIPSLYQQPITLRSGRFAGEYSAQGLDFDTFELSPTIEGRTLPAAQFGLSLATPTPGVQRVRLSGETPWRLSKTEILALWPNANEDGGRRWFRDNIAGGRTTGQSFALDIETGGPETILHDLRADIGFSNGAFKITEGLGYSAGAAGRINIDNDLYTIALDRAQAGPMAAQQSTIKIDLRSSNDPRMSIRGSFNGSIRESLSYLSSADVGLEDLGNQVPIQKTSGQMQGKGEMTLSLAQPAVFKPNFDLQLTLQDLSIRDYIGGLPIRADGLPLRITPERIASSGPVFLGQIASDAALDLRLDNGKLQNLSLTAAFSGNTSDTGTLLGFLPDYVQGEISGDLSFNQDLNGRQSMAVEANLGRATIDLSPLPYYKPVGQPTMAQARLSFSENGLASVDSFKVDGPALHLMGRIDMTADGQDLSRAELRNLIIGDSNLGTLTLKNEAQYMQILINDGQLDGRPIIESILENQGKRNASIVTGDTSASQGSITQKPWLINVSGIRRFVVPGGKAFTDINLSATIDDGAVIQFVLDAQSPANVRGRPPELGNLRASLTPQANGFYRLSFDTNDAGSLFSTLNLTNEIRGGVVSVTAESALPLPKGGWLGSMELLDFMVVDAPIMVQLLSLASLTGILELAAAGGLQFTNLTSNFTYGNSALYLDDLRMAGPSVGMTTEGSIDFEGKRFALQGNVTPFNLVSEIAGSIPILGQVLTGTDGGGLFSAGYKVNGTFANPDVSVNPFQILTPGIYRQWFQDIVSNN